MRPCNGIIPAMAIVVGFLELTTQLETGPTALTEGAPAPATCDHVYCRNPLSSHGAARNETMILHLHLAKLAGSSFNRHMARNFERVCGHKGYTFDQPYDNRPHTDSRTFPRKFHANRVHPDTMASRTFFDCDFVSHEVTANWWADALPRNRRLLFWLLPYRDLVPWLVSQCNHHDLHMELLQKLQNREVPATECRKLFGCEMAQERWTLRMLDSRFYPWEPEVKYCKYNFGNFSEATGLLDDSKTMQRRVHFVEEDPIYATNKQHSFGDLGGYCSHLTPSMGSRFRTYFSTLEKVPPCSTYLSRGGIR